MRTFEEINELMNLMPESWRDYWCEAVSDGGCGCCGCVNVSGNSIIKNKHNEEPITKEEWQMWKEGTN